MAGGGDSKAEGVCVCVCVSVHVPERRGLLAFQPCSGPSVSASPILPIPLAQSLQPHATLSLAHWPPAAAPRHTVPGPLAPRLGHASPLLPSFFVSFQFAWLSQGCPPTGTSVVYAWSFLRGGPWT